MHRVDLYTLTTAQGETERPHRAADSQPLGPYLLYFYVHDYQPTRTAHYSTREIFVNCTWDKGLGEEEGGGPGGDLFQFVELFDRGQRLGVGRDELERLFVFL